MLSFLADDQDCINKYKADLTTVNRFENRMEEGEIQMEVEKDSTRVQAEQPVPPEPKEKKAKKEAKAATKSRDLIGSLKANPIRLKYLRQSLKTFTLIKKNIYLDRKRKQPKNDELQYCLCMPQPDQSKVNEHSNVSYNCGDRCINRMISTECDDQTCRCYELCQNRKFQKHQDALVYPFPAGGKGWGLCAGQKIRKGDFIMQYIGEIFAINSEEGRRRVKQYSASACTYLMKTSKGEVIDPTEKGNLARFINHSCQPNCITQKWNVLGEICIGIFALRDMEENTELTFDYQFDVFNTPLTKCLCGAKKCKGYLGLRPMDITAEQWDERLQDMTCELCNKNYEDDDVKLIICDECNRGFHTYCLDPPRDDIPQEAFYCKQCLDDKERDKERIEKQNLEKLKEKKRKALQRLTSHTEPQEDGMPVNEEYDRRFEFLKKQQDIATQQLYFQNNGSEDDVIIKRKEVDVDENTPEKPKQTPVNKMQTPLRRKDDVSDIYRKATDKFQMYINKNPKFLQQLNSFQVLDKSNPEKKVMLMNKVQMHLIRSNFVLFEKINASIFWDHNAKSFNDVFLKNIELSVIGTVQQINMFEQIIAVSQQIIEELQTEMGITQATISIPAVYLKKFIGPGHYQINQVEKAHSVSIFYHRRFINDECYPIEIQAKLLVKGSKDNITKCYEDIKKRISAFEIQRMYLNPYEIKTILNNMSGLKRKPQMAEFRISRQPPFKDVNHPFFFIQEKNKEITLIGSRPEIDKARKEIMSFFQEPNRKEEFNFNISLFLAPFNFKPSLLSVKQSLEKEVPSIKMMIFDPTPPRKNMTISFLGNRESRQKAKECLIRKLQVLFKEGKLPQQFDAFQDQMNFQMTKYYFKYMQNTLLTKDTAFMKGWDILNGYFYQEEENYMWKSIRKSITMDHQTMLYACFVLKDRIVKKLQKEMGTDRSYASQVLELIFQNMSRITNIQVNSTPSIKNYSCIFDKAKARKLFRNMFPYLTFISDDEVYDRHGSKDEYRLRDNSRSRSRSREKERPMSLFERTILRKNKNLMALLEEEEKARQRERGKRR